MVPQRNGARPRAGKVSDEADNKCSMNDRIVSKGQRSQFKFLSHTHREIKG